MGFSRHVCGCAWSILPRRCRPRRGGAASRLAAVAAVVLLFTGAGRRRARTNPLVDAVTPHGLQVPTSVDNVSTRTSVDSAGDDIGMQWSEWGRRWLTGNSLTSDKGYAAYVYAARLAAEIVADRTSGVASVQGRRLPHTRAGGVSRRFRPCGGTAGDSVLAGEPAATDDGRAAVLCEMASVAAAWVNRKHRELGCSLAVGLAEEEGDLTLVVNDPMVRFVCEGWCSSCHLRSGRSSVQRGGLAPAPCGDGDGVLNAAVCKVVADTGNAFPLRDRVEDFTGMLMSKLSSLAEDRNESPREVALSLAQLNITAGALCIRWTAGYAARLVFFVLSAIVDAGTVVVPASVVDRAKIGARAIEPFVSGVSPEGNGFASVELVLRSHEVIDVLDHVASGGYKSEREGGQSNPTKTSATRAAGAHSMREQFRAQRSRVSPGPLSPSSTIMLNSGHRMPLIGLGTGYADCFRSSDDGKVWMWDGDANLDASLAGPVEQLDCAMPSPKFVAAAITELGYRMVDTAPLYGSEQRVFEGVRHAVAAGVPRSDIFVMTKTWPTLMERAGVASKLAAGERGVKLEHRVRDGGLDYVDLCTEHHALEPSDPLFNASDWEVLRQLQARGVTRSIGTSGDARPGAAIHQGRVMPGQNHASDFGRLRGLLENNVTVINVELLRQSGHDAVVRRLAERKGVSPVRFAVRWSLQMGIPVLLLSQSLAHLREDADVYNFALSETEMEMIDRHMSVAMPAGLDVDTWLNSRVAPLFRSQDGASL